MLSHALVPGHRRSGRSCVGHASALAVLCAAIALSAPSASAAAAPVVIPPNDTSYNALAVAWWQYALSAPASVNPLTDGTGARCNEGQSGQVFFLVGAPFTGTANRACTVHGAKSLFLPLVNTIDFHTDDPFDKAKLLYENEYLGNTRGGQGDLSASKLHASVDGSEIGNLDPRTTPFRACALPVTGCSPDDFSFGMPAANLFALPAGTYRPALQDGYYLLLAPLPPGTHTISFGGNAFFGGRFSQSITYKLNVVP